ncbi:MAG: hypothetical protein LBH07_03400, partial [Treponema sp.]|nr:hypothetical protein [Treponema sp.]
MNKVFKSLQYIFLLGLLCFAGCSHSASAIETPLLNESVAVLGVWWWYVPPRDENRYLDFAAKNGINEIYFYTTDFNNRVGSFIERAGSRGIKVFLLMDEYWYITDHDTFSNVMDRFIAYQTAAPAGRRFAGLHMDIEPHEYPAFAEDEGHFLQLYMDFVVWVCSTFRPRLVSAYEGATIDFDIPCWFNMPVDYKGRKTELYKAVFAEADRVFLMAYKDSAEKAHELAKKEIAYAREVNKPVIVGVETGRWDEEPEISYYG